MTEPAPTAARLRASRLILASGVALAVVLASSCAAGLWWLRGQELADARDSLARMALMLSDQTEYAFDMADLVLRHVRGELIEHRFPDPEESYHLLRTKIAGLPQGQALIQVDAAGQFVAHSRIFPAPTFSVADRDYFLAQKNAAKGEDKPYISPALRSRLNGHWIMPLSRRVPARESGEFGGVIMAAVEVDYLRDFYRQLNLPKGMSILVQKADGAMLASFPEDPDAMPETSPLGPLGSGAGDVRRMIGGEPALIAIRPTERLPVFVALIEPEADILVFWKQLALLLGAGTAVAITAILSLTLLLAAKVGRLEARETDLSAARDRAERALADLGTARRSLIHAERMATLGALVAGVAHEINTPLGSTVISASLLAEESRRMTGLLGSTNIRKSDLTRFLDLTAECSELMLANAQRAADLIRSFKQVAVDQTSDARRVYGLADYLEEVLASLRPRLKRARVAVTVDCPEALTIDGRPGPLAQIVTNLVMNSLTHAFEPDRPGHITISGAAVDGERVRLVYADDGKGIPEEVRPLVFDPFFTTNREGGGSGLGLAIVDTLVRETLGGTIAIDAPPGGGTAFVLEFPNATPPDGAETALPAPAAG